jgi:hypothetical protein
MTREAEAGGAGGFPHPFNEQELAWAREHMTQLRQSVSGQRIVLWSLGIGFVLGLAAYVGGYALGWALWTGVVVALFVEVIPRAKQRQIKRALDAYEAALRQKARSRSSQSSRGDA